MRALWALALVLSGCEMAAEAPVSNPTTGPATGSAALFADAGGLQPSGSALRIDFGREEAGTVAAVSRLLGAGPVGSGIVEECGAGPVKTVEWANGLALNFQNGSFIGWVSGAGRGASVTTARGLGPGTARAAVDTRAFHETTLGTEFQADGVSGILDGDKVNLIWSGITCFFR